MERLLDETRDEIQRADNKANIVLAGAGVAVGAMLAGLIAGDVSLSGEPWYVWAFVVVAGLLIVAGIESVGSAVFPRLGTPETGRARYFTEVAQFGDDLDALVSALREEAVKADERNSDQVLILSKLVQTKYALTQRGMVLLAVGFGCAGVGGLVSRF